jgi:hypothetical protein
MDEGTQQTQALNRERFDVALRDVYQSASDAGDEETQDSLDAVHRALEALGRHVGLVETPETAPDRGERIESALGRLARARAEITEAIEDLPQDLVGARRTLRETNDQVKALIAEALRSGVIDELLARWTVLRPHVEATPDTRELDQDVLTEAISVARAMDQSGDARYDEARAWFHANALPTSYRPVREA